LVRDFISSEYNTLIAIINYKLLRISLADPHKKLKDQINELKI
jgi:hypothetical protein